MLGASAESGILKLPILSDLVAGGVEYGSTFLAELEPHSIWYEMSLTIAAQALRHGLRTTYHVFQHPPDEVRDLLTRFGLDVKKLEDEGSFEIADSYTVQIGIGTPGSRSTEDVVAATLKLPEWSIEAAQALKAPVSPERKRRLHIDDDTLVLTRYNAEGTIVDWWRTRNIPEAKARGTVAMQGLLTGVASEAFYRQLESMCDGIIDFKSEELGGELQHFVRVRKVRSKAYSSGWRRLTVMDNGQVVLFD